MRLCLVHTWNFSLVVVYFVDVNWLMVALGIHSILGISLPNCNISVGIYVLLFASYVFSKICM